MQYAAGLYAAINPESQEGWSGGLVCMYMYASYVGCFVRCCGHSHSHGYLLSIIYSKLYCLLLLVRLPLRVLGWGIYTGGVDMLEANWHRTRMPSESILTMTMAHLGILPGPLG